MTLNMSDLPTCATCERVGGDGPAHAASAECESGGRDHCTCDTCF